MRLARRFLDAREVEADERSLMNLHNNRAGRKMPTQRRSFLGQFGYISRTGPADGNCSCRNPSRACSITGRSAGPLGVPRSLREVFCGLGSPSGTAN
ncbi:hypothetical protein HPB47_027471 [Ixodes persulcatus]|uniref:Uncharacterized protein n=1 Tax=Ixodes persulcatus TaxID=34615 RepID=A0AC60PW24_IXOPE|nr:hypothetical protein HPB47_027471 [Ixodes persulcatus]